MVLDFWEGKRVLVTGGTSFVGRNLEEKLKNVGASYFIFGSQNYDLTKEECAKAVMREKGVKYDFIIHMAALQHAADWPMYNTGLQFHINSLIHLNTLEAWREFQPQAKLVAVGSSCCYPGEIPRLKEEDIDKGPLHKSVYSYGFTKKMLSVGIKAYKDQYKLRGVMPIFATLFGPCDDFDIKTAHVVGALIGKFYKAKKENLPEVEVWGDGTQTRELIFVEDQIDGLLLAAQYCEEDLINIGTGQETTIEHLAESIKDILHYSGRIVYNNRKFVGVKNKVLDIEKARKEFGWTIRNRMHSLKEGLEKTIKWYEENSI